MEGNMLLWIIDQLTWRRGHIGWWMIDGNMLRSPVFPRWRWVGLDQHRHRLDGEEVSKAPPAAALLLLIGLQHKGKLHFCCCEACESSSQFNIDCRFGNFNILHSCWQSKYRCLVSINSFCSTSSVLQTESIYWHIAKIIYFVPKMKLKLLISVLCDGFKQETFLTNTDLLMNKSFS